MSAAKKTLLGSILTGLLDANDDDVLTTDEVRSAIRQQRKR
jgi:hypothetical protein